MHRVLCFTFLLFISNNLLSQGESCSDASLVLFGSTLTANGPSTGAGCYNCSDGALHADWYKFTTLEDGFASISSCNDPGGTDTRFWVYSGDCNDLTLIASSDDANCGIGTDFASFTEFVVSPGIDYYIEWDDRWSNASFEWQILLNQCPTILNPLIGQTTTSTVELLWTTTIPSNNAIIEYGLSGFDLGTGSILNSTNGVVNIDGLNIDTDYHAYIYETCSDSTQSNLLGPINFSTDSLDPPINDDCENAIILNCGETVSGITTFANVSLNDQTCGVFINAPGIWYSIIGDGSLLEASTCDAADYDTQISVFSGSCDSLVCVGGNDDSFPCNGNSSVFNWQSVENEVYYILVHGFAGLSGTFDLTLSCITCPEPVMSITDLSDDAITLDWTPATPGSEFILEYGLGGFIPGNGTTVTGTTSIDGPTYTIDGLDPITNYSVYMLQDCGIDGFSDTTAYLNFTTNDIPPVNDECIDAISINCDTIVSGVTSFANADSTIGPDCGAVTVIAPGIWYKVVGNGGQYTASTCNIASYDTKISIYEGDCNNLSCVAANDDAVGPDGVDCAGFSSIATWATEVGVEYYILVHGYDESSFGAFNMELTCAEPCNPVPENEICSTATVVALNPTDSCSYLTASNLCASTNLLNPSCDPFGIIQDVWFQFNSGANTNVVIDFQYNTATNGSFALYDQCGGNEIYCSNNLLGPEFLIGLESNTDYYIQFWSDLNEAGTFDLCISADSVFSNSIEVTNDKFKNWQFYPNPAFDRVHIVNDYENTAMLSIYNMNGMLIERREISKNNIVYTSEWSDGIYLFIIEAGNTITKQKIIKH